MLSTVVVLYCIGLAPYDVACLRVIGVNALVVVPMFGVVVCLGLSAPSAAATPPSLVG